LANKKSVS